MGYVDSAPYFGMSTEKISNMANEPMDGRHTAPTHPLKRVLETPALEHCVPDPEDNEQWTPIPPKQPAHALAQVDIYLDNFISTYKENPK